MNKNICKICPLRNTCKVECGGSCGLEGRGGIDMWATSPDAGWSSSYREEGKVWKELGTVPVGGWKYEDERKSSYRATFKWRDGLRTWENVETGEIVTRIVKSYYKEFDYINPEIENNDLCFYCGSDNGPQGEYRQGWDCCQCGCN